MLYYLRYLVLLYPLAYGLGVYALRGRGWSGLVTALLAGVPLAIGCLAYTYAAGLYLTLISGAVTLILAVRREWFAVPRKQGMAVVLTLSALCAALICWVLVIHGRADIAINPERDPEAMGYIGVSTRQLLGSMEPWGPAAGEIPAFIKFMPDFVPVLMAAWWGWIPAAALCGTVLFAILWAGWKGLRQKNALGQAVSLAVMMTLGMQFLWASMMNLGVYLLEGSMPFIAGRLASAVNMLLMGLLLSVFRNEELPLPAALRTVKRKSSRIRWEDGELTISCRRRTKA